MIAAEPTVPPPGRLEQIATRLIFFIGGLGFAAWAPLIPYAKERAALSEGALGLLLLCLGTGSLLVMPLSGALASRYGCRRVLVTASLMLCAALPLLATLSNRIYLGATLFIFGVAIGLLDCAVNIQAVIVERASGRRMMSGFHGMFSVGGFAGAAGVSLFLISGASPLLASLIITAAMLGCLLYAAPALLAYGSESTGPAFAIPRGFILFIGALSFVAFLAEGAILDWSAVFLTSYRQVAPSHAGLGYAAFAIAMTLIRLTGDSLVHRVGALRIVVLGSLLAATGLTMATLLSSVPIALIGYALVGAGAANIVPVLYTALGRQKVVPEHHAIPAVSTLAYAGVLAGPAAIGLIAQVSSLQVALMGVTALLVGVAISARWLKL
jgi:MFS family permease